MKGGACLAVALLLAAPATAQDHRTGTLAPRGGDSSMVEEAGRFRNTERAQAGSGAAARRAADEAHGIMRIYGSCLVATANTNREREALVAFLRTPPDGQDADGRARAMNNGNCLSGVGADFVMLRYQAALLRGVIFRQLYLDLGRQPSRAAVTYQQIASVWTAEARGSFPATLRFADCVVAADPSAADALLKARIGSSEQKEAVGAVAARMGGCLQRGLTLQMSRIVLEGVLAEALYRRASAPTPSAALLAGQR